MRFNVISRKSCSPTNRKIDHRMIVEMESTTRNLKLHFSYNKHKQPINLSPYAGPN